VFITLDPADVSYCIAYTAEGERRRYIDRLSSNRRLPANCSVEELREAIASVRRRNKHFDRAQREAPKRLRDASGEVAALRREQREHAMRATGTDDARAHTTNVKPVRTRFETVSRPARSSRLAPSDPGDLADLLTGDRVEAAETEDDDLRDLLSDEDVQAIYGTRTLADLNAAIERNEPKAAPKPNVWARLHDFVNDGKDADEPDPAEPDTLGDSA
jgi:hypothetical protein